MTQPKPRILAMVVAVAWLVTPGIQAEDPPPPAVTATTRPLPADGTELFRGLLTVEGITAVKSIEAAESLDTRGLILILIGQPLKHYRLVELASRMIVHGGAVLILAEESANLSRLAPNDFHFAITGRKVFCTDATRCLDGNGWMPFPEPYISRVGFGPEVVLIDGLTRIATNVPSNITVRRRFGPGDLRGLATFPIGKTVYDAQWGPFLNRRTSEIPGGGGMVVEDDQLFAVATAGPKESDGKLLVLSDTSVFVNEMLARGATGAIDNLTFAVRVVRWLKETDRGVRGRCLFVENGEVVTSFAEAGFSPRPAPPPPPVPVLDPLSEKFQTAIADAGDRAAAQLEDNNWFNRALVGRPGNDRRFANALRVLAGLLVVAGVWWVFVRARSARFGETTPAPPRGSGTLTAVGSLAKRQADLIQSGDVTGPVRDVVFSLFVANGLSTDHPGGPAPAIVATGPNAPELAARVRELWTRVLGPAAKPITAARWKELEPMLDEVYRAADSGRWRVAPQGGTL